MCSYTVSNKPAPPITNTLRSFDKFVKCSTTFSVSTVAPAASKFGLLVTTIFSLFGNGRGIPLLFQVPLPITTVEFVVTFLKWARSFLLCGQGRVLFFPIPPWPSHASIARIICLWLVQYLAHETCYVLLNLVVVNLDVKV